MDERFNYIDFLKGVAIIFVILTHTMNPDTLVQLHAAFHIWQAVPVFIAVTFYLNFSKLDKMSVNCVERKCIVNQYYSKKNFARLFKKIILPWMIVVLIELILVYIYSIYTSSGELMTTFINRGGIGPGAYYFYIYMQFWVLMPFIYLLQSIHKRPMFGVILMFIINAILNIACNYSEVNPEAWRCLFVRYLFLSCISYIWLRYDNLNVWLLIALSCVSVAYWYLFDSSFGMLTYSESWAEFNWPAYFYTLLFIKLLGGIYTCIANFKFTEKICFLGRNSWYIFLLQMFILGIASFRIFSKLGHYIGISNNNVLRLLYIIFGLFATILPIYLFELYKAKERSN